MSDVDPRLLIFLHIPKAAGTTLYRVLRRQYPPESVFQNRSRDWLDSIEELKALPDAEKRAIRVIQGHMGFGVHRFFPQPATYITIVREPVARVVSHYEYVLRTERHYLHDEVVSRGMTLLEYACSGLASELENGQTKLLAGLDDERVDPTPENLELAKDHIREHFALAGLSERFDESVLLLKRALGWGSVVYESVDVAPRSARRPVDPDALEAIRERNLLDVDLHRFCAGLLDERVAAEGASFERELKRFRQRNAAYGAVTTRARRLRGRLAGIARGGAR